MTRISALRKDSSTSSIDDNEDSRVRKFARSMLKSSLFIGTFIEKRFVEPLNSYRDVIKVSDEELDFIGNIKAVRKRCLQHFQRNVWIGITEPSTIGAPAGYNLWVTLSCEVFGSFWYKVKSVDFLNNEVRLRLEVVRPVDVDKTPMHNISPQRLVEDVINNDFGELANRIKAFAQDSLKEMFQTLTWTNLKEATKFLVLLVFTLITFAFHAVQYLMEYFLKLIKESSGFIQACTPIIITILKVVMSTISGFYGLLETMFKGKSTPQVNQIMYPVPAYNSPYSNRNLRALPYGDPNSYLNAEPYYRYKPIKSSVKITPLD